MADKTLPPEGLSGASMDPSARRAFLRRAVGVGVPVVLATVHGRSVLAQNTTETGSGCLSMHPSGWLGINRFGGNTQDPNYLERVQNCQPYLNPDGAAPSGTLPPQE